MHALCRQQARATHAHGFRKVMSRQQSCERFLLLPTPPCRSPGESTTHTQHDTSSCVQPGACTLTAPPLILPSMPFLDTFLTAYSRDTASMSVATKVHLLRDVASNGYMQAGPVPERCGRGGEGRGGGRVERGRRWKVSVHKCSSICPD